jgi:hypothetical protein
MRLPTPGSDLGRHVFGAASVLAGLHTLVWHDYTPHLAEMWNAPAGRIFVYAAAAALIVGGVVIQFGRTAKTGALILGAVYLVFVLLCVPTVVTEPQTYLSWGDVFYELSLLTGAAIVYGRRSPAWRPETLQRIGRIVFGICVVSFTLEQAIYLKATADLVPKWFPPSQMFWAIATTVTLGLAAVALLANRMALLATRLLTLMLLIFGLFVWVPLEISDPHNHFKWSEGIETFAIAGAAWILAELLGSSSLIPTEHP